MAIAGRVAIVPKGDWSADATYKRLDAVTHNNTLYFAKKDVPAGTATSNTEYWSKSVVGGEATVDDTISSESTNPVQNKVVKAYVDKKVIENVDFYTSTSKLLNDSIEAQLVLSNATRNLLNPRLSTTTKNGITCTNNGDGTYTFNGTATDNVFFDINKNIPINKGTKYKAVCFKDEDYIPNKIISCVRRVDIDDEYIFYNGSFVSDSENCWLWVRIDKGVTVSNLVAKPMVTTDLNATYDDFVPYSGYDIKTCGKNIVGNPSNRNSPTVKDGVVTFPAKSAATDDTYLRLYTNVDISAFDTFRVVVESINETINDSHRSYVIIKTAGKKEFSTNSPTSFEAGTNKYISNVFNCSDFGNKIEEITVVVKKGYAYPGGSYKVSVFNGKDKEFSNWVKYVESSVHIDSTTEFPLLGLKSFDGETNIISPGNVEVTYAKSDSGKAILDMSENKLDKDNVVNNQTTTEEGFALDARQANPNLDGTLAKQISYLNGSLENLVPVIDDCDLVTTHLAISNNALNNPYLSGVVRGDYALILTVWIPTPQPYNQQIAFVAGGDEIALRSCGGDGKWGAWKKINVN